VPLPPDVAQHQFKNRDIPQALKLYTESSYNPEFVAPFVGVGVAYRIFITPLLLPVFFVAPVFTA